MLCEWQDEYDFAPFYVGELNVKYNKYSLLFQGSDEVKFDFENRMKRFNDEELAQEKYEESKDQITGGLELIKENESKYEEDNFGSFGGKEIIEEKNEKKSETEEETHNKITDYNKTVPMEEKSINNEKSISVYSEDIKDEVKDSHSNINDSIKYESNNKSSTIKQNSSTLKNNESIKKQKNNISKKVKKSNELKIDNKKDIMLYEQFEKETFEQYYIQERTYLVNSKV